MFYSIRKFLKKIKSVVDTDPVFVLRVSVMLTLLVTVVSFVIQYRSIKLIEKKIRMNDIAIQLENDIKIISSDYISLISPFKLKQLSEMYLPSLRTIKSIDKISVNKFK